MKRARKPNKLLLKKLPEEVDKLRQVYPEARVELWSQDEHRIGLKPILRRVWARKGSRVRAMVRPRYQWLYLYGFVEPESGKTSWFLMPTVNTQAFSLALRAFAEEQGVGPNKQIALVLDQAGWHKSRDLAFLKDCTCSFCHRIRLNYNQPSACGRSPMNRSLIGPFPRLTNWNRCKPSDVVGSKLIQKSFGVAPPFTGGLLLWTLLKRV
jgi:hypothetical protein